MSETVAKSKTVAGILGIILGGFGVHKFYLGDTKAGIIRIVASLFGIGFLWGFIEGILLLVNGGKDAAGNDLV